MAARQDRQSDDMYIALLRGFDDLLAASGGCRSSTTRPCRRQRARTATLLGAVGMTVETRLADERLRAAAELRGHTASTIARTGSRSPGAFRAARETPVGARVLAEDLSERRTPFAGGDIGFRAHDGRLHDVAAFLGRAAQIGKRRLDRLIVARCAPGLEVPRPARPRHPHRRHGSSPRRSTTATAPFRHND